MKKHFFKLTVVLLLCFTAVEANAQWAFGLKGGLARTTIDRSNMGRIDETYSALNGVDLGFQAKVSLTDWFAICADLDFMDRTHRMDRNLNYLDPVFTKYRNTYVLLPVTADFSFGGEHLRGHMFCGGYGGYWMMAHNTGTTYWMTDYYVYFENFQNENHEFNDEDQRLTAGLTAGLGLSYDFNDCVGFNVKALYYYDLVSHHKDYAQLRDPRYLNTLSITIGFYSTISRLKNASK